MTTTYGSAALMPGTASLPPPVAPVKVRVTTDKSKLKTQILRSHYPSAMIHVDYAASLTRNVTVPPRLLAEANTHIVGVVEDASVRFVGACASASCETGDDLLAVFTTTADETLAPEDTHTLAYAFDKYFAISTRKKAAQAAHDVSLRSHHSSSSSSASSSSSSSAGPPSKRPRTEMTESSWRWDGQSPIVVLGRALPPYADLMSNRAARAAAIADLAALLATHYTPPPGTRVIVDASALTRDSPDLPERTQPYIIETDEDGVRTVRSCRALANGIGEGDHAAQYYARLLRRNGATTHTVDVDADECRASALACAWHAGDDGAHLEQCPTYAPIVESHIVYERGSVVIRTSDTDLVPLALVAHANEPADAVHRDYVAFSTPIHLAADSPAIVTAKTEGARRHHEICDITELARVVAREAHVEARDHWGRVEALLSFAVFAFACGNDYVVRLPRNSHVVMQRGYALYRERTRTETPHAPRRAPVAPVVDFAAFELEPSAPMDAEQAALAHELFDGDAAAASSPPRSPSVVDADVDPEEVESFGDSDDECHSIDDLFDRQRRRTSARSLVRFTHADDELPERNAAYCGDAHLDEREFKLFVLDCYRARLVRSRGGSPPSNATWAEVRARVSAATKCEDALMPTASALAAYTECVAWTLRYALTNAYECAYACDAIVPAERGRVTTPRTTSAAATFAALRTEALRATAT